MAGISLKRVTRNGDFILAYRDPSGAPDEPRELFDNKDKDVVGENDIDKRVRDARERSIPVAVLVARGEDQLRQVDRATIAGARETAVCGYYVDSLFPFRLLQC